MRRLILLTITLVILINVCYASFPVMQDVQIEIANVNESFQDPWYISLKNAILFLVSSVFGVMLTLLFFIEGFIAEDREGPIGGLVAALLIGIGLLFSSVFYGRKVWRDKLSQKMILGIISLFIIGFLLMLLTYGGGFSGG
jgi:hypothetical protein